MAHKYYYAFNPTTKQNDTYGINPMRPGGYKEQVYDAVCHDFGKKGWIIYSYTDYYNEKTYKLVSNTSGIEEPTLEIL